MDQPAAASSRPHVPCIGATRSDRCLSPRAPALPAAPRPAPQLRSTRGALGDVGGGKAGEAPQLGIPGEPFTFESHARARGVKVTAVGISGEGLQACGAEASALFAVS